MRCQRCRTESRSDADFCAECGVQLRQPGAATQGEWHESARATPCAAARTRAGLLSALIVVLGVACIALLCWQRFDGAGAGRRSGISADGDHKSVADYVPPVRSPYVVRTLESPESVSPGDTFAVRLVLVGAPGQSFPYPFPETWAEVWLSPSLYSRDVAGRELARVPMEEPESEQINRDPADYDVMYKDIWVALPPDAREGVYVLGVMTYCHEGERTTFDCTRQVTVEVAAKADYVITAVGASKTGRPNGELDVVVTVHNRGNASGGCYSKTSVGLSRDAIFGNEDDLPLGVLIVPPLAPGESHTAILRASVPNLEREDRVELYPGARANADEIVCESNVRNNGLVVVDCPPVVATRGRRSPPILNPEWYMPRPYGPSSR